MNSYHNAYQNCRVQTATPERLTLMLLDGLINNIERSIPAMKRQEIEIAHRKLMRAQEIVVELLRSLDIKRGGEIAKNLRDLYGYALRILIQTNLKKEPAMAEEVISLIRPIRDAWASLPGAGGAGTDR